MFRQNDWNRFDRLYRPLLRHWASRLVLHRDAVDELVQDVFVVLVAKVAEDHGRPFLVMEFLKGMTLDNWLNREQQPPLARALQIGQEIALGLAAVHENGLIHRDIKPSNVWLDASHNDRVKVLDLGLARAASGGDHLTQSGAIVGTPAFMAPEQGSEEARVDHRADLWSLGVVLYRLVAGQLPFKGHDPWSTLASIAVNTPRPVRELNPSVPVPLEKLIMQMLEKQPEARPATAQAVADTLACIAQPPTIPWAPTPPKPEARPDWLVRVLVAALAIVLLFVLLVASQILIRIKHKDGRIEEHETDGTVEVSSALGDGEKPQRARMLVNSMKMPFVLIQAGKYMRGSTKEEQDEAAKLHNLIGVKVDNDHYRAEGPQHEVVISKAFYLGETEVTQEQYAAVMGRNPSWFSKDGQGKNVVAGKDTNTHPVESVSWYDAKEFCQNLSAREEETKAGREYRLPTEAE